RPCSENHARRRGATVGAPWSCCRPRADAEAGLEVWVRAKGVFNPVGERATTNGTSRPATRRLDRPTLLGVVAEPLDVVRDAFFYRVLRLEAELVLDSGHV